MNIRTSEMKVESYPCVSRRLPVAPLPAIASEARAYLRRLRAAEMAAWELSGGDCLIAKRASRLDAVQSSIG